MGIFFGISCRTLSPLKTIFSLWFGFSSDIIAWIASVVSLPSSKNFRIRIVWSWDGVASFSTQRMRNVINKGLTEEDIINGCTQAFSAGWNKVKLYFMLGQPTETNDDVDGIMDLCEKIAEVYYETVPKEQRKGKCQITASSSFFVPKPFTPFQCPHACMVESRQTPPLLRRRR